MNHFTAAAAAAGVVVVVEAETTAVFPGRVGMMTRPVWNIGEMSQAFVLPRIVSLGLL